MSGGYISFFNASSRFSDAELQSAIVDFQSQVDNEFRWYWGIDPYLDINGSGSPVIIVDYPGPNDPQGALGYHWVDGNDNPYAVVFAGLCDDYGYSVTGVLSHELLEMAADQLANTVDLWDFGNGTGIIVIQEVCDPCELNLYYEAPNGTIVSDFALPSWFSPIGQWPYDALGAIPSPLTLASGGYISYQSVTLSGWQQAFADKADGIQKAAQARRRAVRSGPGDPRRDTVEGLRQGQPAHQKVQTGHTNGQRAQVASAEGRQRPPTVVRRNDLPEHMLQVQQQTAQQSRPARQGGQGLPPHVQKAMAQSQTGSQTQQGTSTSQEPQGAGPRAQQPKQPSQAQ